MRNNQYIKIVLIFAIMAILHLTAAADTALPPDVQDSTQKEAITILLRLEIMKEKEDGLFCGNDIISRDEFAAIISKISGEKSSGGNAEMKSSEAEAKLIDLLGYGAVAEQYGYDKLAERLKLTVTGEMLTRENAAKLVWDALRTNVLEASSSGVNIQYSNKGSVTLMEKYMDKTVVRGRVDANAESAIKPYTVPGDGNVLINGVTYRDRAGAETELGRDVIAVVGYTDAECYAYCRDDRNVEDTVIHAADIIRNKTKLGEIYYESSNGSIKKKTFSDDAVIIYNGEVMDSCSDRDLRISGGELILAHSYTTNTDVLYINEYQTQIAEGANEYEMKVFFKDGKKALEIDRNDCKLKVYIGGIPGNLGDISEFDAVDIYQSKSGDVMILKVTKTRISGSLDSLSEDRIHIAGKEYERSAEFFGLSSLIFGQKYAFIVNSENIVCGVDNTEKETGEYGYLYRISGNQYEPEEGIFLKILTTGNEFVTFRTEDTLKINDRSYKPEEFFEKENPLLENGAVKRQMILYEKNSGGQLTRVYTAQDNTSYQNKDAQLRLDVMARNQSTRMYRNTFGINYRFSNQTKVFVLSPNQEDDETKYSCRTIGKWGEDHRFSNYEVYNTKRSREIGLFVTYEDLEEDGYSEEKQKSNIIVVKKCQQVVNASGDVCYELTYFEAGAEKTAYFDDDTVYNQYPNAWSQYPKTLTQSDIKKGDIMQLVINARDRITEFHMLFRISEENTDNNETLPNGYAYTANSVPLSYLYTAYGEVVDLYDGTITVDVNNTTDPDNEAYNRNFKFENVTSFLLYDGGEIKKISSGDLMLGDKVFVRAYNYIPYNVIVIR